jgi:hypothetical protein
MANQPITNRIKVRNPEVTKNVVTYLTNDIAAGVASLPILNKQGFFEDDRRAKYYVILGDYEDEKSEIVLIDANNTQDQVLVLSGTTTTKYSHAASDPVVFIKYNKVWYFGLANETSLPASPYNISYPTGNFLKELEIDTTQQFTEYIYDGALGSIPVFRSAWYNEEDDELSSFSDPLTGGTYSVRSAKRVIDSACIKALTTIDQGSNSVLNYPNALIIAQDGLDEITTRCRKWNFLQRRTDGVPTTIGQNYIPRLSMTSQLQFLYIDGEKVDWRSNLDFGRLTTEDIAETGIPEYFTEKNGRYYLYPTPDKAYSVTFEHHIYPIALETLNSDIDVPFVPIMIYYCAAQFAYIRGNDKRGDKMYAMYQKLLEQQIEEWSGPIQSGDAEYVEYTSELEDNYI